MTKAPSDTATSACATSWAEWCVEIDEERGPVGAVGVPGVRIGDWTWKPTPPELVARGLRLQRRRGDLPAIGKSSVNIGCTTRTTRAASAAKAITYARCTRRSSPTSVGPGAKTVLGTHRSAADATQVQALLEGTVFCGQCGSRLSGITGEEQSGHDHPAWYARIRAPAASSDTERMC